MANAQDTEVTVQKVAESNGLYRDLAEHTNDLIQSVDLDGHLLFVNRKWQETLGYDPDSYKDLNIFDIIRKDYVPYCKSLFEKIKKGHTVTDVSTVFIAKDGREVFVEGTITPKLAGRRFVSTRGFFRDVTEERQAQSVVREKAAALDALADGVLVFDESMRVMSANQTYLHMFGLTADDVIGRSVLDIKGIGRQKPEELGKFIPLLESAFEGGFAEPIEFVIVDHRGEERTLAVNGSTLSNENKNGTCVIAVMRDITARKQAEKNLEEQRRLVEDIFANVHEGIGIVDKDENVVLCNPAYATIFDETVESIRGKNIFGYLDDAARETVHNETKKRQAGEASTYELPVITAKGQKKVVRVTASPRYGENGTYIGAFGAVLDITAQKKVERSLQESEERFRLLAENVNDVIWTMDRTFTFRYVSPSVEKLRGFSVEEVLRQKPEEALTPASLEKLAPLMDEADRLIEKGVHDIPDVIIELEQVCKDGTIVQTETIVSAIFDERGAFSLYLGVSRDITARKKAEEAALLQQRYFESLFNDSPEAIASLDRHHRIMNINPAFERLFGFTLEEIRGKNLDDLIIPKRFLDEGHRLTESVMGGKAVTMESVRRRKDGSEIDVSILGAPIIIDGNEVGIFGIYRDISERKRAEAALRKSEEKYSAVVEASKDGIIVIQDGILKFVNTASLELLGYDSSELVGKSFAGFIVSEYLELVQQRYIDRMAGKDVPNLYEIDLIRQDGTEVPVELNASIIIFEDRPADMVFIRDITERREAQTKIQESEAKYRTLFELSPELIILIGLDVTILDCNEAVYDVVGIRKEDVVGKSFMELGILSERELPTWWGVFEQLIGGEKSEVLEVRMEMFGKSRWIEAFPSLLQKDGSIYAMQVLVRDITARKEAEQEIHKLSYAVEQSPSTVIITDPRGSIEYVNPKFTELTGYTLDEVRGKNPRILKSGEMPPEEYENLWRTIAAGDEWRGEFHNKKKNGDLYWELASISPIKNENGTVTHYIAVKEDITARKRAEAEAQEHREQLKLINKILRHDLTNDITVIRSALRFYEEEGNDDFLNIAFRRIDKSVDLIRRMREFESVLATHKELKPYDTSKVIEKVMEHYPNVDITVEGSCTVLADEAFHSVIDNIINNAIKHGGTETLAVTAKRIPAGCELRIADTGKGVPDDVKEKIFDERFSHGDTAGTGLGLYIVRKTVERYGGTIRVEDNDPKGAVFVIALPEVEDMELSGGNHEKGR
jgi:hypothetical protein